MHAIALIQTLSCTSEGELCHQLLLPKLPRASLPPALPYALPHAVPCREEREDHLQQAAAPVLDPRAAAVPPRLCLTRQLP